MFLWRLELFGGIQLSGQGSTLTRFRTRKTAALLALLALRGRPCSREELIETFWPEAEPEAAAHSLRQALSSLRPILGEVLEAPQRGSVGLKPGALLTDVEEFETELSRARQATAKPTEAHAALRRALALQRNELLPELYDDWVIQERERLKVLYDEAKRLLARWESELPAPPLRRPAPRSIPEGPLLRQLPLSLSSFVGRSQECNFIQTWWESGQPLLTITGLGGSGKTRLALRAAEEIANRGTAAVFVSLAEREDPAQLYELLRQALGEGDMPWKEAKEAVRDRLRALPGRLLLVLDNLEQLMPQRVVEVLRELLQQCPAVSLLVTSRIPLEMEGEQELPLGSLPPDRSLALLVERARAISPGFALTVQNEPILREVCLRLGGVPLALELAAAHLRVLTPRHLLELLTEHGCLTLTSRRRDLPERHRMLQSALQWSLDLQDTQTRAFFLGLTVFRGGWTLESAARVVGVSLASASAFLGTLLRHALIVRDSEERFAFLVPVHEFAAGLLTEQEKRTQQEKHADALLERAEEFRQRWSWTRDEARWVGILRNDLENLRAALRFLEETAPEQALRLAATLMRFWYVGGLWREGFSQIERLLTVCPDAEPLVRLRALNSLGNLAKCLDKGDSSQKISYQQSCLELARSVGDQYYWTVSLHNLALAAWDHGELDRAEELLAELLPRRDAEKDRMGIALTRTLQAGVYGARERFEEADSLLREALGIFQAEGNHWGIVCALNFYAPLELARGEPERALAKQDEALALALVSEDDSGRAYGLAGRGDILVALGRRGEAQLAYEEGIEVALRLGEQGVVQRCHRALKQ